MEIKKHTDIGESAPRLRSRKKEAESSDATAKIIGLVGTDDMFIGGSEDHTLPFTHGNQKKEIKSQRSLSFIFRYLINAAHIIGQMMLRNTA